MNKKLVLFIDDNDISEIIGKLQRRLQKEGITLIPSFLNLKEERFKKENPENKDETVLDFNAIKEELKLKYMNERFDLIGLKMLQSRRRIKFVMENLHSTLLKKKSH
jgi:hypothetical protein